MIFKSKEEQNRVERIMKRLEVIEEVDYCAESVSYASCRVNMEEDFVKVFGEEAGDISTLIAVYLYDKADKARKRYRFRYTLGDGRKEDFSVVKDDDVALIMLAEGK